MAHRSSQSIVGGAEPAVVAVWLSLSVRHLKAETHCPAGSFGRVLGVGRARSALVAFPLAASRRSWLGVDGCTDRRFKAICDRPAEPPCSASGARSPNHGWPTVARQPSGMGCAARVLCAAVGNGVGCIGCDQLGCIEELVGMGQTSGRLRAAASLRSSCVSRGHAMVLCLRSASRAAISGPASTMESSCSDAMTGSSRRRAPRSPLGETSCREARLPDHRSIRSVSWWSCSRQRGSSSVTSSERTIKRSISLSV